MVDFELRFLAAVDVVFVGVLERNWTGRDDDDDDVDDEDEDENLTCEAWAWTILVEMTGRT